MNAALPTKCSPLQKNDVMIGDFSDGSDRLSF